MRRLVFSLMILLAGAAAQGTAAAELKLLTAGAFKQVLLAAVPEFEKQTGHKVTIDNATVGALVKRVEQGETFDLLIATPQAIDALVAAGKVAASGRAQLAKVGIGVVVKEGTPRPDIGTVDAFRRALIAAKSVAYIDPAAGGSSGVYVASMLQRLGVADVVKPKTKLIAGGTVAEHIADGEAELGIHQISEILPVRGVTLVGPLPAPIQSFTVYAAGVGETAQEVAAARALIAYLISPAVVPLIEAKGMSPAF